MTLYVHALLKHIQTATSRRSTISSTVNAGPVMGATMKRHQILQRPLSASSDLSLRSMPSQLVANLSQIQPSTLSLPATPLATSALHMNDLYAAPRASAPQPTITQSTTRPRVRRRRYDTQLQCILTDISGLFQHIRCTDVDQSMWME